MEIMLPTKAQSSIVIDDLIKSPHHLIPEKVSMFIESNILSNRKRKKVNVDTHL